MAAVTLDDTDAHLRSIISNLYMLIVQAHEYRGSATQQAVTIEIKKLLDNLLKLSQAARRLNKSVPIDIINYIEGSRNPDIYNREFVELIMRYNQQLKGRSDAFAAFRDILGREMASGIPEIRSEVQQIVEHTGGKLEQ